MSAERDFAISSARHILESHVAEPEQICRAIVEIGKPYDAEVIRSHADLVAIYLNHPDHVVRYKAIWFLGSWGHLSEYALTIHDSARMDAEVFNRAFAAKSLGSILKREKDTAFVKHVLTFVENEQEEIEVRLSAYSGLLYAWNRPDDFAFLIGERAISEVDCEFLTQLHAWIQGRAEMPQVAPPRGILSSIFHAIRAGRI